MKSRVCWAVVFLLVGTGCRKEENDRAQVQKWPSVEVAAELPVFTKQANEIEIADSFSKMHPTVVLGAVVKLTTGEVISVEHCLTSDAKPQTTAVLELVFKRFLENSAIASAEWLGYLKGQVNDTTRAEVTVTEVSDASIDVSSIDDGRLQAIVSRIPAGERGNHGIVIGYRDFALSASLFKEQGIEGHISGYGAKIGGKWFGKREDVTMDHRLVAVWSPLPFVVQTISNRSAVSPTTSFAEITRGALTRREIQIAPTAERRSYVIRRQP